MTLFRQFSNLYFRQVRKYSSVLAVQKSSIPTLKKFKLYSHLINTCQEKYAEMLSTTDISAKICEHMRENILNSIYTNEKYVDALIMDMCYHGQYIDAGIAYYTFLKQNNYNCSVSTILMYLKLCSTKKGPLAEADKNEIKNLCKTLVEQYSMLDHQTTNYYIGGLCKAGDWKKAYEMLNTFEEHDKSFLYFGYTALINYFFENDYTELGYECLKRSFEKGIGPMECAYPTYIQYCLRHSDTFQENMETLFGMWRDYDVKPHQSVIDEYIKVCNRVGWSANKTVIKDAICNHCKENILEPSISKQELKKLSTMVLEKLIVKSGYITTYPDELQTFMKFIAMTKPYDVVIDSLNILYNKRTNGLNFTALRDVINQYENNGQKVVVIARSHIQKSRILKDLTKKTQFFFLNNLSRDDAFTLYAALTGERDTKIVSSDLMRQHKHALADVKMRVIFKKWQFLRQIAYVNDNLVPVGSLIGEYADALVQNRSNYWHIPFQTELPISRLEHTNSNHWACFKICSKET